VREFETRPADIREYCDQGIIPIRGDYKKRMEAGKEFSIIEAMAMLMGQSAGAVSENIPAKDIVEAMVNEAIQVLRGNAASIAPLTAVKSRL